MQGNRSQALILTLREKSTSFLKAMDVYYTTGPRFIDGVNIDLDVNAALTKTITEREISDPVTGLDGEGYEPGQKNLDGSDL